MTAITRRAALGALGSLIGVGLAGAITLVPVDAKKRKKKKKGGKKGNGGGNNVPGGNTPPPVPPPDPQFETVTRTFNQTDAVGIDVESPSNQYPSKILVTGLAGGTITNVTVRIPGFQHDFPDDVDMLLVGPQGQDVLLMSDVFGNQIGTELFDLTFDDAGSEVPDEGPMTDGTFRPTNIGPDDDFEEPALPPSGNTSLGAAFNGTDPSGTWSLFIMDDSPNDGGVLIGGWSLIITARIPV